MVPVAIHGSEKVREARRGVIPKVTVQYGEPINFPQVDHPTSEQSQEVSEQIFDRVRATVRGALGSGPARRPRPAAPRAPRRRACHGLARFLRTCQWTVISATVLPSASASSTFDRELHLAVGVQRCEQLRPCCACSVPVAVIGPFASFR